MHYFLFLGLVELLILSYKDIKTLRIDSRFNWFMYGVTASLIATEKPGVIYLFSLMIAVALISALLSRFIPSGDVECLGWCMFGFGMLHWVWLVVFLVYLFLIIAFTQFLLRKFFKIKERIEYPGVPLFLYAFIMTTTVILKYA